jgi:hypothetical protein
MSVWLATVQEKAWIPASAGITCSVSPAKAGVHS